MLRRSDNPESRRDPTPPIRRAEFEPFDPCANAGAVSS